VGSQRNSEHSQASAPRTASVDVNIPFSTIMRPDISLTSLGRRTLNKPVSCDMAKEAAIHGVQIKTLKYLYSSQDKSNKHFY
jgi:hypothetical protein